MSHLHFRSVYLFLAMILLLTLASCEKEVHIKLATSPTKLVVQGAVENGIPPYVILTSTIGFFSTVDLTTLSNSFIHGADIKVSDGANTVSLVEYSLDTAGGNKFYVYSIDTANLSGLMLGEFEKTYSLTIVYNGITYTSVTKIPTPKGIDSMWFDLPLSGSTKIPPNAKQLFINYSDPDTLGNNVRYFTKKNSEQFYASDQLNDEVVNGKLITDIPLYAGFDNVQNAKEDSLRYFYPGDTVILKWSAIDKKVYNFWNSFAYATNSLGNPFATPINLQTNMTNGALGVWAGYGSVQTTKVVPH